MLVTEMKKLVSRKRKERLAFTAYLCRMASRILNQLNVELIDKGRCDEAMRYRAAWLHLCFALNAINGKIGPGVEFEASPDLKRVMSAIEQVMVDAPHLEKVLPIK